MTAKEQFIEHLMNIFNGKIAEALQNVPNYIEISVLGGKAINVLLDRKFNTSTSDWDVNVISTNNQYSNVQVRDYVGSQIVKYLKKLLKISPLRIKLLEDYYRVKILDIVYEVNPYKFTAFTGDKYTIGHVNVVIDKYKSIGIVDLVPIIINPEETYVIIDGIKYLSLRDIYINLNSLLKLPNYFKKDKARKRLGYIEQAIKENALSCNFYRVYYKQGYNQLFRNLINCGRMIFNLPLVGCLFNLFL